MVFHRFSLRNEGVSSLWGPGSQCARLHFLLDEEILELMCDALDKVIVDGDGQVLVEEKTGCSTEKRSSVLQSYGFASVLRRFRGISRRFEGVQGSF